VSYKVRKKRRKCNEFILKIIKKNMSNFGDLININEYWDKREEFNEDRWGVAYYCKDCKKIVDTKKIEWNKIYFLCNKCEWLEVVIGTFEGLKSNYRIK